MSEAMHEFDTAVSTTPMDIAQARTALTQLEVAIETHLSHEEADVFPTDSRRPSPAR